MGNGLGKGAGLVPALAFHFEHGDGPEFRPGPIAEGKREDILAHMIAGFLAN